MLKEEFGNILGIDNITDNSECIKKVLRAIADLPEEDWRSLDKKIREWYDDAAEYYNEGNLEQIKPLLPLLGEAEKKVIPKKTNRKITPVKEKDEAEALRNDEPLNTIRFELKTGEIIEGDLVEEEKKFYILLIKNEESVIMKNKIKQVITEPVLGDKDDDIELSDLEENDSIAIYHKDEIFYGNFIAATSKSIIILVQDDEKVYSIKDVTKITYHKEKKKSIEKNTVERKEKYITKVTEKNNEDMNDKQHKMDNEIEQAEMEKGAKIAKKENKQTKDKIHKKKPAGIKAKEIYAENPLFDKAEILNTLRAEGFLLSMGTLSVIYSEFNQTVEVLAKKGLIENVWKK